MPPFHTFFFETATAGSPAVAVFFVLFYIMPLFIKTKTTIGA